MEMCSQFVSAKATDLQLMSERWGKKTAKRAMGNTLHLKSSATVTLEEKSLLGTKQWKGK